MKENNENHTTY